MHWRTAKLSQKRTVICAASLVTLAAASADVGAQESSEAIAKAALNPVAAMISVPIQYNYDRNIGLREDGRKNYVNVQPVIPISLDDDWNLISRTIVPLVWQSDIFAGAGSQSGVGDITQSFFFSPKKPTADGWIWGAGPVIYLPTASDDLLGADKWGLGPTAVLLKQEHGWTYGVLANHIWSVGGAGKADINSTFLQPFLSYTTASLTTFGVNTESTYNWKTEQWAVPINFMITQFLKIGEQRLTVQGGARYWADSPDSGAHGWGARFTLTLLFPR
jgi:hypothetical protein